MVKPAGSKDSEPGWVGLGMDGGGAGEGACPGLGGGVPEKGGLGGCGEGGGRGGEMGGGEARPHPGGGQRRAGGQKGPEGGGCLPGPAPVPPARGVRWLWLQLRLWRPWPRGGRKMATAVAGSLGLLWGWLWSERFWLPQNVSWADLEGPGDGYGYPRARHILSVFPLAAGVFSVRLLFER